MQEYAYTNDADHSKLSLSFGSNDVISISFSRASGLMKTKQGFKVSIVSEIMKAFKHAGFCVP